MTLEQIANDCPRLVDWVAAEVRSAFRALVEDQHVWGRSRPFAQPPEMEGPLLIALEVALL